jgi:hypothetical protein
MGLHPSCRSRVGKHANAFGGHQVRSTMAEREEGKKSGDIAAGWTYPSSIDSQDEFLFHNKSSAQPDRMAIPRLRILAPNGYP